MGKIHGAQDPDLGGSVGQMLVGQLESRTSKEDKGEPKEGGELLYASPELQDLLLEGRRAQVRHVQAHHDFGGLSSHPRAVERGTPRSVAMVTSPVRWTRFRSRWSQRCCGRAVVGMDMIISRSLMPLNSLRTMGSVRRGDHNSRGKAQNVHGDSLESS
jgi:hypothetical protein